MLEQRPNRRALCAGAGPRPDRELYPVRAGARIWRPPARIRWSWGALIGFLLALGPARFSNAQASTGAQPETKSDGLRDAAQAHFEAAMEHYRARRYREAIREFEQSAQKVPNAEVWFDIGRAHEQLGELELAIENYRRYLRDRVDAPDAPELTHHIEALARRAAHAADVDAPALRGALAVDASQAGALVLLDGRALGPSPIDRVLDVAPGPHRLEASRPGYIPFRARVDVQEGALSAAYIQMHPLTRYSDTSAPRLWTWIAAGAGAAALLTSGGCGLAALSARDAGRDDAAQRWALASDVALGGALTLALSAALLYFIEPDASRHEAALNVQHTGVASRPLRAEGYGPGIGGRTVSAMRGVDASGASGRGPRREDFEHVVGEGGFGALADRLTLLKQR